MKLTQSLNGYQTGDGVVRAERVNICTTKSTIDTNENHGEGIVPVTITPLKTKRGFSLLDKSGRVQYTRNTWEECMGEYIMSFHRTIILNDGDLERYEKALKQDGGEIIPVNVFVVRRSLPRERVKRRK